jgi:hypothetical protein
MPDCGQNSPKSLLHCFSLKVRGLAQVQVFGSKDV